MTLSLALASAALSACTATPSQEPPEPALVVRGGANPSSLFEVARDYAAHLGKPLVVSDRTESMLKQAVVGLLGDVELPTSAVVEYAQTLLVLDGFVVTAFDETLEIMTYGTAIQERRAIAVDREQLAALDGHQAVYVDFAVELPYLNSRQLAVTMQLLGGGNNPGTVLSPDGDHSMRITGPADLVLDTAVMFETMSDPESEGPRPLDWGNLFPQAKRGLQIEPDQDLAEVLLAYGEATGRNLWASKYLRPRLEGQGTGLLASVSVPQERLHAFVEGLLASHGYSISVHRGAAPNLHAIVASPSAFVPRPLMLDANKEDLSRLRDHPATMFAATASLRRLEVRQLTTSMRSLMTDTLSTLMLTTGEHTVYIHAPGLKQAFLIEVFLRLNGDQPEGTSAAAGLAAPAPPSADVALGAKTPSLLDLLTAYSKSTGRAVVVGQFEAQLLGSLVAPEGTPPVIPAGDIHTVVEAALAAHHVGLDALTADPPLLAVSTPTGRYRGHHRLVDLSELEALEHHRSLLVSAFVPLEKLEVRHVAASVRGWMTSPSQEHVIAASGHALLIGGTVDDVRERAGKLREYDARGELPPVEGR